MSLCFSNQELPAAGIQADVITYNAAISACEKAKQWPFALWLLQLVPEADVITFSAAISACGQAACWPQSLSLLQQLVDEQLRLDIVTYNSVISAVEKQGLWQLAIHLLAELRHSSLSSTLITHNALVSACEKAGQWQHALRALALTKKAPRSFGGPDLISCNAFISACQKAQRWTLALAFLGNVGQGRLRSDVVTCSSCITACSGDSWQTAFSVWAQAREQQLHDSILYSSAVSAFSAQWEVVFNLLSFINDKRVNVDVDTLGLGLAACEAGSSRYHATRAQARYAISLLDQLERDGHTALQEVVKRDRVQAARDSACNLQKAALLK